MEPPTWDWDMGYLLLLDRILKDNTFWRLPKVPHCVEWTFLVLLHVEMVFHIILGGNLDHLGPGQHWRNQKSHRSALFVVWQIWNKFLEEKLDLPLLSRQQVLPKHVDEEINCFARVLGSATFFHPANVILY